MYHLPSVSVVVLPDILARLLGISLSRGSSLVGGRFEESMVQKEKGKDGGTFVWGQFEDYRLSIMITPQTA